MITQLQLNKLAQKIRNKIKEDFKDIHLSGNLMDTITIEQIPDGYRVTVNAKMYDISKFKKEGIIVYNNKGSYAQEVDVTGGFSGKHKDYIERAVTESLQEWLRENNLDAEVTEV